MRLQHGHLVYATLDVHGLQQEQWHMSLGGLAYSEVTGRDGAARRPCNLMSVGGVWLRLR